MSKVGKRNDQKGFWTKKAGQKTLKREKEEEENFEDVVDKEAGEWSVSGDG